MSNIIAVIITLGIMAGLWQTDWGKFLDVIFVLAFMKVMYDEGWLWWGLGGLVAILVALVVIGYMIDKWEHKSSDGRRNTYNQPSENHGKSQSNVYKTNTQANNTSNSGRKKYNIPPAE